MWEAILDAISDAIVDLSEATADGTATDVGTFAEASTSEIGSEINAGGGDARAFRFFSSRNLRKWLGDKLYGELEQKFRRRANHTKPSRGNPYNIQNIFDEFFADGNAGEIKKFVADTVRKYLTYHLHMSNSVVDRAVNAIREFPLRKGQRILHQKHHNQGWYYLYHGKHSDDCIYAIRIRNVSRDKLRVEMALKFMTGPVKTYNYFQVPLPIFVVMTMIPLTYLTKNGFLAGAWNFFWYSCVQTGIVSIDHPGDRDKHVLPFANRKGLTDAIKDKISAKRLRKIANQPKIKIGKAIKYLAKPHRKKEGSEHGW